MNKFVGNDTERVDDSNGYLVVGHKFLHSGKRNSYQERNGPSLLLLLPLMDPIHKEVTMRRKEHLYLSCCYDLIQC